MKTSGKIPGSIILIMQENNKQIENKLVRDLDGKKQNQNSKVLFLRRDGSEVGSMIAGPDVYICDICIGSSVDILKNNLRLTITINQKVSS